MCSFLVCALYPIATINYTCLVEVTAQDAMVRGPKTVPDLGKDCEVNNSVQLLYLRTKAKALRSQNNLRHSKGRYGLVAMTLVRSPGAKTDRRTGATRTPTLAVDRE